MKLNRRRIKAKLHVGQQVRLHPATDLFMRGVAYATITKLGIKWVHLHHWLSQTRHKVSYDYARTYFLNEKGDQLIP